MYNTVTLQIYSPSKGLCLDDFGNWGKESTADNLAFTTCAANKVSQQFVYIPSPALHIRNVNDPYGDCLDGGGGNYSDGLHHPFLWPCDDFGPLGTVLNHQWDIIKICPPGKKLHYIHSNISLHTVGTYTVNVLDSQCTPCPPGTFSGGVGTTGACDPCSPGVICLRSIFCLLLRFHRDLLRLRSFGMQPLPVDRAWCVRDGSSAVLPLDFAPRCHRAAVHVHCWIHRHKLRVQ